VIVEILLPVGRLFAATMIGFALFKIRLVRRHLLVPVVFLIVNVVFPLYFVHTMPSQWSAGIEAGWEWMAIFFVAFLVFLAVQYALAKLLVNRVSILKTDHPQELIVLFAMQNAGYIPIPIIAALAPPAVSVYMSFYMMAFVLTFFTFAVWVIQSAAHERSRRDGSARQATAKGQATDAPRPRFKLNAPVVGILLGLLLAVTGWYDLAPGWVKTPFRWSAIIALDAIMVVLGGVLASIPSEAMKFRREFGGLVLVKMVLYPLAVLGLLALIPLQGIASEIAAGIKLAFVVEAVVPPATNVLVLTKAYGTDAQVEYAGGAIVTTYLAGLVLLPAFLIASTLLFG